MNRDEFYMRRCLELAELGLGKTYPNPMVGCVIVHKDEIIGEGWHQKAGKAHAEVNAINSVSDPSLLSKSSLYVNLEPCSHYGKTPPCALLIIKHQIPRVVVGCVDLFSEVSGKGIQMMIDAGIDVTVDVLKEMCEQSHKRFFTFHNQKRPYIILKWAESKDGFIAPANQEAGTPHWITGLESKKLTHKWRTEEASIMVGTNTVEKDNPMLTARIWEGVQPVRLIIDRKLRLSDNYNVFDQSCKTIVFTEERKLNNGFIEYETIDFEFLQTQIMQKLYDRGIQSVIVEGGRQTLQSFIDSNLWDEARVFSNEKTLQSGISSPNFKNHCDRTVFIGSDCLKYFYNNNK